MNKPVALTGEDHRMSTGRPLKQGIRFLHVYWGGCKADEFLTSSYCVFGSWPRHTLALQDTNFGLPRTQQLLLSDRTSGSGHVCIHLALPRKDPAASLQEAPLADPLGDGGSCSLRRMDAGGKRDCSRRKMATECD